MAATKTETKKSIEKNFKKANDALVDLIFDIFDRPELQQHNHKLQNIIFRLQDWKKEIINDQNLEE